MNLLACRALPVFIFTLTTALFNGDFSPPHTLHLFLVTLEEYDKPYVVYIGLHARRWFRWTASGFLLN